MSKTRKFINIKGFDNGLLYILCNPETSAVTSVFEDGSETFIDHGNVTLRYANKFCTDGFWAEHPYDEPLSPREEVLVKALREIANLYTKQDGVGEYAQSVADDTLKQLRL